MSTCSGCGAAIVWGVTAGGAHMPLDAKPVKRAVLMPVYTEHGRGPYGEDLYALEYDPAGDGSTPRHVVRIVDTFTPHHATCPKAEQFRRRRST